MLEGSKGKDGFLRRVNDSWAINLSEQNPNLGTGIVYSVESARAKKSATLSQKSPAQMIRSFADNFLEMKIASGLAIVQAGTSMKQAFPKLGETLTEFPVKSQMVEDMVTLAEKSGDEKGAEGLLDLSDKYGLDPENIGVLRHPDFLKRIGWSALGNNLCYLNLRNTVSLPYFAMLATSPSFQEFVTDNPVGAFSLSVGGLLAASLVRMRVERKILEDQGLNADILQTTLGLMNGSVDSGKELRAGGKFAYLGVPVDLAWNFLLPPWSLQWIANPPYSIPAYIGATAIAQIALASSNLGFVNLRKLIKRA